jgi:hypothetical protein
MKRTAIVLALTAAMLFPLASYAGVLAIPIGSIRFPGLGDTTARPVGEGVVELRTTGLRGVGVVACDADCPSGFDGATVGIGQQLLLRFDVDAGAVSGSSRGVLFAPEGRTIAFEATVQGTAECTAQPPKACSEIEVRTLLHGPIFDRAGVEKGQITLILQGHLSRRSGEGVSWTRLRGRGILGLQTP